jgi:glycosyltransferase XagB
LGAILFDSDISAAASRSRSTSHDPTSREELFRRRLMEARAFAAASEQLSQHQPAYSARWGMNAKQRIVGLGLIAGYGAWLYFYTEPAANFAAIAIAALFAVIIAMRFWTVIAAFVRKRQPTVERASDEDLPTLSVLVPLYREANVVSQLVAALSRLDYPRHLLDVKLLV